MISAHFSEAELVTGLPAGTVPPAAVQQAAVGMAALLERVRAALGVPLKVTSWWRDGRHNVEVGGVAGSQHLTGNAADVIALGVPIGDAFDRFTAAVAAGAIGDFGQAIFYPGRGHIHLSTRTGTSAVNSVLLAFSNPDGSVRYTKGDRESAAALPRSAGPGLSLVMVLIAAVAWLALLGSERARLR